MAGMILLTSFSLKHADEQVTSLYNVKWQLVNLYDSGVKKAVEGKTAFIQFNRDKMSAGGNGGCNTFGGTLIVKGNTIGITEIISTQMYCEGVQQTENLFFKTLPKVNRYIIKGKTLSLYRDNKLLLEFIAK